MSIELPGELVWVIDLLGYNWPQADEDAMRAAGHAWRAFADQLRGLDADATRVAHDIAHNNTGVEIDAFAASWPADQQHRDLGAQAADLTATLLDGGAIAVQATKIAILGILAITAAEIIAAQLAAPETLGASEAGAIAAEEAGRYAVREALGKLRQTVAHELAGGLRHSIEQRLRAINPARMMSQASQDARGATRAAGDAHTVTIRFDERFSRPQFDKKAGQLSQLSDEGKLYKAPNPVGRDQSITRKYKGDVIRRVYDQYGERNPQFAEACKRRVQSMDADHIHDLQLGGHDSPDNLQLLHRPTNRVMGTQQIWPQIKNVPDGTPIRIVVER